MTAAARFVGRSVPRVEDRRILTGRGRYLAGVRMPGMAHAVFVRSPLAHAAVTAIDPAPAAAAAGVLAVITAEDLEPHVAPLQVQGPPGYRGPVFAPLARDRVRHVGDPVAIVLARTEHEAYDAAELVEVDYEPLPPLPTAAAAAAASVQLFDDVADNIVFRAAASYGAAAAAFDSAGLTVHAVLRQHRYAAAPLEPRGGLADFDGEAGSLTYVASSQNPHGLRMGLAGVLGLPLHRVRVIAGDVGGGFGQKMCVYREDVALCAASKLVGRPVRWVETRTENLTSAGQAREETLELEAAVTPEGLLRALRGRIVLDHGAYPVLPFAASAFTAHVRALLPDAYAIEAMEFEEVVVATTKASYVPYRGPWCSAPWAREVLLDRVARAAGIEPAELRLRNLVPLEAQPARMVTGPTLAAASARETLVRLLELVDVPAFRREQQKARAAGRRLGLGIATLIEPAPGPPDLAEATGLPVPPERAVARIEPDGTLTVTTSQHPHGQGGETTLAQVAADALGVDIDRVRVVHGDTDATPFGVLGTSGSRAAHRGSGAALQAVRAVREQALAVAGTMLEIGAADLELAGGVVRPRGVPGRELPLAEVAAAAYFGSPALPADAVPGALEAGGTHRDAAAGWTSASHCCVVEVDVETGAVRVVRYVEVDVETGAVRVVRYVVVHDCGPMINPAIVQGQIHGGVVQGLGGALLEECAYDEEAGMTTATFLGYLVPTATDVPQLEVVHLDAARDGDVPYTGVGEGGALGAPPAVTNAVVDAVGVDIDELPLTPERVLRALRSAP